MKVAAIVCIAALAAVAAASVVEMQFVNTEAKTPEEHDQVRQEFIDAINAMPGVTWKAGFNPRFKGKPLGASKDLCGVKPGSKEAMEDAIAKGTIERGPLTATKALPTDFDSATNWPQCAKVINDIRDQSACGCCWAFGAAEAASDRLCIATNATVQVPLSAQDLCFCAESNGCGGGFLTSAWHFIGSKGIVTGSQFNNTGPFGAGFCSQFSLPHCHHHGPEGHGGDPYPDEGTPGCPTVSRSPSCPKSCDASASAPHNDFDSDKYGFEGRPVSYGNADSIAEAIMSGGPVETAFTVYSDFENYVSGVYKHTGGEQLGGHAVRIVGWGEDNGTKYWKIANSWNPYWGEDGYFRIVRGTDECGIESQAVATSATAKWGKK